MNSLPWRVDANPLIANGLLIPRRRCSLLILDFEFVYDLFDIRHLCDDFFDCGSLRLGFDASLQSYDTILYVESDIMIQLPLH